MKYQILVDQIKAFLLLESKLAGVCLLYVFLPGTVKCEGSAVSAMFACVCVFDIMYFVNLCLHGVCVFMINLYVVFAFLQRRLWNAHMSLGFILFCVFVFLLLPNTILLLQLLFRLQCQGEIALETLVLQHNIPSLWWLTFFFLISLNFDLSHFCLVTFLSF